jgi:Spy/CpxP family protein refolding chaperone
MKTKANSIFVILAVTFFTIFSLGTANADDESYGWGMMGGGYGGMGMHGYGMMGGHGGMGMMGGGCGGMGMGGYRMLDLTQAQRTKIESIQQNLRKSHFAMMEKIIEERQKLPDLYNQENPSASKIGAVYGRIFAIQRQMIESSINSRNQMNKVLTKEQREQMQQWHRGMWRGGYGPHGRKGNPEEMHRGPRMMH